MRRVIPTAILLLLLLVSHSAEGGEYYLQAVPSLAPICGTLECSTQECSITASAFQDVYVGIVVDCHGGEGFRSVRFCFSMDLSNYASAGNLVCPGFAEGPCHCPYPFYTCIGTRDAECAPCCSVVVNYRLLVLNPVPVTGSFDQSENYIFDCNLNETRWECGGSFTINGPPPETCQCAGPTETEADTWGGLRGLFN
jgi:hypothetical protein